MGTTVATIRIWLAVLAATGLPCSPASAAPGPGGNTPSVPGFPSNQVVHLQIEVSEAAADSLRRAPRSHVRATVREGSNVFDNVALRLKGRTGSFRAFDDKPSFTLDAGRFVPGRTFGGTGRLHLNNSVEDPSFLHDWLGSDVFRAAGIPTPLVTHARVELNGRALGLYVLKEGFDPEFLVRCFGSADGNLYEPEPGPGADIAGPMRRSSGSGVDDRSDLKRLAAVAAEGDLAVRSREFDAILDTDRFLTFLALEILLGHRDGYALARNNYRLCRNPGDGRFVFMPGGMDNLLGRADASLHPRMAGTVAEAVLEIPERRRAYRERLATLFTNQFQATILARTVVERADLIARGLPRNEASGLREQASLLARRIADRAAGISRQLSVPEPAPLAFVDNAVLLEGWRTFGVPEGGVMEEAGLAGVPALHVRAASKAASSWRTQVWLLPGRYRFEARVRTRAVKPLALARTSGVYLNVPGHQAASSNPLAEDQEWTPVRAEFELVAEDQGVELQCVFRAESGEAWFDLRSLRLLRLVR